MILDSGLKFRQDKNQSEHLNQGEMIIKNAIDLLNREKLKTNYGPKQKKKENPLKLLKKEVRSNLNKLTPNINRFRILELAKPS